MSSSNSGASTPNPRFKAQSRTAEEMLAHQTIGLVNLSDFRKRRAEAMDRKEKDLHDAAHGGRGSATPSESASTPSEPAKKKKRKVKTGTPKLSFGSDDEDESRRAPAKTASPGPASSAPDDTSRPATDVDTDDADAPPRAKFAANAAVGPLPRSRTKAALLREAAAREMLRKEFLARQEAVKGSEVGIPFVFYDGVNTPGGTCRMKKGDQVWLFLDRSRKVGAELGVGGGDGGESKARREWARVSVDDLMLVRGEVIIPPHYDFYYFIINRTTGPSNRLLFDYSDEPPASSGRTTDAPVLLSTRSSVDVHRLEGASDDPTFTKVVDRRWYERNKHIFPASVWQDFDPEKDYSKDVRRDAGGNTLFFT